LRAALCFHGPLILWHFTLWNLTRWSFTGEQAALEDLAAGLVPERRLWSSLVSRDRRWNNRNAVFFQCEVNVRPLAPILGALPLVRWLATTAIDNNFQVVFGTHRRLDGRKEITTEQPIARDDAEASGQISHDSLLLWQSECRPIMTGQAAEHPQGAETSRPVQRRCRATPVPAGMMYRDR